MLTRYGSVMANYRRRSLIGDRRIKSDIFKEEKSDIVGNPLPVGIYQLHSTSGEHDEFRPKENRELFVQTVICQQMNY